MSKLPKALILAKDEIYEPCGFEFTNFRNEPESSDYSACRFKLNNFSIVFRVAKITPTKTGQFVTSWKRVAHGSIEPFNSSDSIDFLIIHTSRGSDNGQFIFPKSALIKHGIMSTAKKDGKRGFRVYPPWDEVTNRQAQQTKAWQAEYFQTIPVVGAGSDRMTIVIRSLQ